MGNIEVGEYVRTTAGIFIISHINIDFDDSNINKCLLCQKEKCLFLSIDIVKTLKHSKNIIDLTEIGDYVNGKEVIGKFYEKGLKMLIIDTKIKNTKIFNKDIKSILTKKQFTSMQYEIEE